MKVSKTDFKTQKELLTKCIGYSLKYDDTIYRLVTVEIGEISRNPKDLDCDKYWEVCVLQCNEHYIYPKIYEVFKIFYPHLCSW